MEEDVVDVDEVEEDGRWKGRMLDQNPAIFDGRMRVCIFIGILRRVCVKEVLI